MATLENLGKKSLAELDEDEAIEMLRQIRLSRRTQKFKPKKKSAPKKSTKGKKDLSALQAKKLLEILGG